MATMDEELKGGIGPQVKLVSSHLGVGLTYVHPKLHLVLPITRLEKCTWVAGATFSWRSNLLANPQATKI